MYELIYYVVSKDTLFVRIPLNIKRFSSVEKSYKP